MTSKTTPIESALRTIEIEKRAIDALKSRIGGDFESVSYTHLRAPRDS